jgi:hypothetical protein
MGAWVGADGHGEAGAESVYVLGFLSFGYEYTAMEKCPNMASSYSNLPSNNE